MRTPEYAEKREVKKVELMYLALRSVVEKELAALKQTEEPLSAAKLEAAVKSLRGLIGVQKEITELRAQVRRLERQELIKAELKTALPFPVQEPKVDLPFHAKSAQEEQPTELPFPVKVRREEASTELPFAVGDYDG